MKPEQGLIAVYLVAIVCKLIVITGIITSAYDWAFLQGIVYPALKWDALMCLLAVVPLFLAVKRSTKAVTLIAGAVNFALVVWCFLIRPYPW